MNRKPHIPLANDRRGNIGGSPQRSPANRTHRCRRSTRGPRTGTPACRRWIPPRRPRAHRCQTLNPRSRGQGPRSAAGGSGPAVYVLDGRVVAIRRDPLPPGADTGAKASTIHLT